MTHIGFTGTRFGMSDGQRERVGQVVAAIALGAMPAFVFGHHGDCIGADAEFHAIMRDFELSIIVHPGPIDDIARQAGCIGDERREPLPHMRRNANIVRESTVMIAAPAELVEQPRGGTWRTIGMARKARKPLAIVWRDGRIDRERWM